MGEIPLLQTLHALVQMLYRQHDAPQDAEIPQPVDQRRLLDLIGNAPEKVDKDDKIERVDGEGASAWPPRVPTR